LPYLPQTT